MTESHPALRRRGESREDWAKRLGLDVESALARIAARSDKTAPRVRAAKPERVAKPKPKPKRQRTYEPRKDVCKHGHTLDAANVIVKSQKRRMPDGTTREYRARQCKRCHADQQRARYREKRMRLEDARVALKRIAHEVEARVAESK